VPRPPSPPRSHAPSPPRPHSPLLRLAAVALAAWPAAAATAQGPPPSLVRTAEVVEQELRPRRTVSGELRSPRESLLASIEPGIVEAVFVREGEAVAAGTVIARIDGDRMALDRAVLESEFDAARSDLVEREAELRQARRDLDLVEESRRASAANIREELDATSRAEIGEARVEQARRRLAVYESRLALLDRRLADLSIRAPFDGVVVRRAAEAGQWLAAGGEVALLVEVDRLEAWLALPQSVAETWAPLVRAAEDGPSPGPVVLRVDATGETVPLGRVRIVPAVDRRGRTFAAIAEVENPAGTLLPGMSATAYLPVGPTQPYLTVPKNALLATERGARVWVLRPGPGSHAVAVPVAVEAVFPTGDAWAIRTAELRAGDQVVVEGNERLMPGAPVIPIDPETTGPQRSANAVAGP